MTLRDKSCPAPLPPSLEQEQCQSPLLPSPNWAQDLPLISVDIFSYISDISLAKSE